jgi:hypothetical protein
MAVATCHQCEIQRAKRVLRLLLAFLFGLLLNVGCVTKQSEIIYRRMITRTLDMSEVK